MNLMILLGIVLGAAGAHAQSPTPSPQPAVASPEGANVKAEETAPTPGNGVYHVGGSVKPPIVVKMVDARFSKEAHKKKISTDVLIRIIVDEKGMPQDVTVVRSAGYGLDEEAIKAAKQYRFKPATRDGQPVKVVINLDVNFQTF